MRTRSYLSLGSNVGNRAASLNTAIERLARIGEVAEVSSFYETAPVEMTDQPWFLNCVVALETEKSPRELLEAVLRVEQEMGRQRKQKKGPRNIDIDILLFADAIVNSDGLTIPHPALHLRRFVLEPLAEIAPGMRHPVFGSTIQELRDLLGTGQDVKKAGTRANSRQG